jgi:hypothetical protein
MDRRFHSRRQSRSRRLILYCSSPIHTIQLVLLSIFDALQGLLFPLTKPRDAVHMARHFKHARLIQQDNAGHCTPSARSQCTINAVRAYLNGTMMPREPDFDKGTWPLCDVDEWPWRPIEASASSGDDERMVEAWQRLGDWRSAIRAF